MSAQNSERAAAPRGAFAWPGRPGAVRAPAVHGAPEPPPSSGLPQEPVRFVWGYVRARAASFAVLSAMVIAAAGCAVAIQYMMKLLVDGMAGGPAQAHLVWTALAVFVGLIVVENALWRASGWLGCRTTIAVGRDIRLDLFSHISGHPVQFFAERFAGALGHRITATAGNFGALVNTMVWRVAPPCVDFIGALIVFSTVEWRMALAMTAFVAVVTAGLIITGQRGRPHHQAYAEKAGEAGGELVDVLTNIWTVKAFSAGPAERLRLSRTFDREAAAQRASWMYNEKTRLAHDLMLSAMAAGMLVWAILLWSEGRITPGDVVVVSALTFRILHGSRDLAMAFVDTVQNVSFIRETLMQVGRPPEVADVPQASVLPPAAAAAPVAVRLDKVSFNYPNGTPVLDGIDLTLPARQKVGIVGPSGAGKSTLVGLIQRLHDVPEGRIEVQGHAVRDLTQDSLRASLGVVPQEVTLFHRTIMENIRFARPEASDADVHAAARAARCEDFIQGLRDGYDTFVGERGTKLSGGQRQRVGIARVFLKNPPIVVLDEATSALDTQTEQEIQAALADLMRERTVIAVAHRLSTLIDFDRIVVLDHGRIVEDGAPRDLLERADGVFAGMWTRQNRATTRLREARLEERRQ